MVKIQTVPIEISMKQMQEKNIKYKIKYLAHIIKSFYFVRNLD